MKRLLQAFYFGLVAWQGAWLLILPEPAGWRNPSLLLVALVPLLITSPGVARADDRGLTWASWVLIPYFLFGVTEAWSNPPQRLPAVVQLFLALACWTLIGLINRRRSRQSRGAESAPAE